jgi:hypothetical protein
VFSSYMSLQVNLRVESVGELGIGKSTLSFHAQEVACTEVLSQIRIFAEGKSNNHTIKIKTITYLLNLKLLFALQFV